MNKVENISKCKVQPYYIAVSYSNCDHIIQNIWTQKKKCSSRQQKVLRSLTFRGPCIVIYSYNTANEMQ